MDASPSPRHGTRKDGVKRAGDPNRAILWAVIGNGVGLATLMLVLACRLNARIDHVNASLDDMSARIDNLQDDIRELRGLVSQALNESPAAD